MWFYEDMCEDICEMEGMVEVFLAYSRKNI